MALTRFPALTGFRLNAREPDRLADFFVRALGFKRSPAGLALGPSRVALNRAAGAPYPAEVPGWSPLFQHFAIVTADMGASLERLIQVGGWAPITEGGAQTLPLASGGVTAFKFRDPEGHPLELIAPAAAASGPPAPRIDHSAISVSDSARSIAFYAALGFRVGAQTLNQGPEQDRLDGLENAQVEVTALVQSQRANCHLELLAYQGAYVRAGIAALDDVAATRIQLRAADAETFSSISARLSEHLVQAWPAWLLLRDPDGHLVEIAPDL